MLKRLAIVSSYNDLCGNATYTEVIRRGLSEFYEVDVLSLNVRLLNNTNKRMRVLGDKHIKDMCSRLHKYDYVNIQFEAGLYGGFPSDILRRVKWLIDSSSNVLITMHRVDIKKSYLDKDILRNILSRNLLSTLRMVKQDRYFAGIYSGIIKHLSKRPKLMPANVMVHTKKELETVRDVMGFANVYDHPLTFLSDSQRIKYERLANRPDFKQRFGLADEDKTVGVFGFISEYKGHETAIRALSNLPENYNLLIFGSQHPYTIAMHTKVDHYLGLLIKLIEDITSEENDAQSKIRNSQFRKKKKFSERVHFLGNLKDDEFINALYCCDFVALPYWETNQSGSGIASLAIETKSRALFANNLAFKELARYFPESFETFDIGNHIELAQKIYRYRHDFASVIDNHLTKYNVHSNMDLHRRIFEGEEHAK